MAQYYKTLLFDLDDTLIDNRESVRCGFKVISQAEGEPYTDENFELFFQIDEKFWKNHQDGKTVIPEKFKASNFSENKEYVNWLRAQRFLQYFKGKITLERAVELNDLFIDSIADCVVEIAGAKELLCELSKRYEIIVITNGPSAAAKTKLEKIASLEYVAGIYCSDQFGFVKPDVRFFQGIMKLREKEKKNTNLSDFLMIGDSLKSDVGFAQNCGIHSCWFRKVGESVSGDYKPTYTVTSLLQILGIFK